MQKIHILIEQRAKPIRKGRTQEYCYGEISNSQLFQMFLWSFVKDIKEVWARSLETVVQSRDIPVSDHCTDVILSMNLGHTAGRYNINGFNFCSLSWLFIDVFLLKKIRIFSWLTIWAIILRYINLSIYRPALEGKQSNRVRLCVEAWGHIQEQQTWHRPYWKYWQILWEFLYMKLSLYGP